MRIEIELSLLGLGLACVACTQREELTDRRAAEPIEEARSELRTNEPSMDEVTARVGTQSDAIDKMVEARCAREKRCDNIGVDRDYASDSACSSKLKADMADDLNTDECPGGIVLKELDECLAEIRNDDCGNPLDTLERIVACRDSDLCKAMR